MRVIKRAAAGLVLCLGCLAADEAAKTGPIDVSKFSAPIRVACVGDSITYGVGVPQKQRNVVSYPAQLGEMLGEKWAVKNFGDSGTTMLNKGDRPYQKGKHFHPALDFNPDVVVIMLGTNDSKEQNWKFKDEFEADAKNLIDQFKALPSKPQIFLCDPIPVPKGFGGINDPDVKAEQPMIANVAKEEGVAVIDLYAPLADKPEDSSDGVHPKTEGASIMAKTVFEALTGKPYDGPLPPPAKAPTTKPAAAAEH